MRTMLLAAILSTMMVAPVLADAPPDPVAQAAAAELARLNAEAARLNAEAAVITAQTNRMKAKTAAQAEERGPLATPKEGAITNPDKALGLVEWAAAAAREKAVAAINAAIGEEQVCNAWFITSFEHDVERQQLVAAELQRLLARSATEITAASGELKEALEPQRTTPAPTVSSNRPISDAVSSVSSTVAAIDTLLGLFRTNYTFSDASMAPDELALRLAIAQKLQENKPTTRSVVVDGVFAARPVTTHPILVARDDLAKAITNAAAQLTRVPEKPSPSVKKLADALRPLVERGSALDQRITAIPEGGNGSILVGAALALSRPREGSCVLMASHTLSGSTLTRTRLMSRNDTITLVIGGVVRYAIFGTKGGMHKAGAPEIRAVVSYRLDKLAELAEGGRNGGPD